MVWETRLGLGNSRNANKKQANLPDLQFLLLFLLFLLLLLLLLLEIPIFIWSRISQSSPQFSLTAIHEFWQVVFFTARTPYCHQPPHLSGLGTGSRLASSNPLAGWLILPPRPPNQPQIKLYSSNPFWISWNPSHPTLLLYVPSGRIRPLSRNESTSTLTQSINGGFTV